MVRVQPRCQGPEQAGWGHGVRVLERRLHGVAGRIVVQRLGQVREDIVRIQHVLPDAGPGRARVRLRRAGEDHHQERVAERVLVPGADPKCGGEDVGGGRRGCGGGGNWDDSAVASVK